MVAPVIGGVGTLTCGSDLNFNGGTNVVDVSTNSLDLIAVGGNLNLRVAGSGWCPALC